MVCPPAGAIDVEYKDGGDSCPGVVFAASNIGDVLGVSDVFPGPCGTTLASTGSDHILGVNVVDLIQSCPGANVPQGAAPDSEIPLGSQTRCNGSGSGATLNFPAPNSLSIPSAGLILHDTASNWSKVGGQSVAAQSQQGVTGSGTRITECFNVFGPGADSSCLNSTTAGAASSSGVMENDICGPWGGSPVGPVGAIGYTSRATILLSAQTGAPANTPVSACGIVN
jgi:hypothetical protein